MTTQTGPPTQRLPVRLAGTDAAPRLVALETAALGGPHAYGPTQTKLQAPRSGAGVIARPALVSELHRLTLSHALTLVSAPAGYGKTTLLTQLLESSPDLATAWLSLDSEDNDCTWFLAGLIAPLRQVIPGCGVAAEVMLNHSSDPGSNAWRIVGALVNDLVRDAPAPLLLVLDDVHLVTQPQVYVALEYLLGHLPASMHVLVSARHDPPLPLARMRGRGQLAELRTSSIRFTLEDAADFQLSGGDQHRGALARALAPRPRLILLNELLSVPRPDVARGCQSGAARSTRHRGNDFPTGHAWPGRSAVVREPSGGHATADSRS